MWHAYLVTRTMGEMDPGIGRYRELREISQIGHSVMQKATEVGVRIPEVREVVGKLCWFLLRQAVCPVVSWSPNSCGPNFNIAEDAPTSLARQDARSLTLLSAAALLNLHSLAQRLLDAGHNPEDHGSLLAPAMQAAAQAGNVAMLERLGNHQVYRNPPVNTLGPGTRVSNGNWAIVGAAIRGDLHVLQNVLAHEMPRTRLRMVAYLKAGVAERSYASTPAIYDCITNALPEEYRMPSFHAANELVRYAELGNVEMVRHLLNRGASAETLQRALLSACRGGQLNVVLILIQQGVDPQSVDIHDEATTTHCLDITRLLLRLGVKPDRRTRPTWRLGPPGAFRPYNVQQSYDDDTTVITAWVPAYLRDEYLAHENEGHHVDYDREAMHHAFHRENIPLVRLLIRYDTRIPNEHKAGLTGELEACGYDSILSLSLRLRAWGISTLVDE